MTQKARQKSKLVESLGINTVRQFDKMVKKCRIKKPWDVILKKVIIGFTPYKAAGKLATPHKTKHAVYEMLKVVRERNAS